VVLHLGGEDLVALRLDDQLRAAGEVQARLVAAAEVARVEDAVLADRLRGRVGVVHVPEEDLRALEADLADRPVRQDVAGRPVPVHALADGHRRHGHVEADAGEDVVDRAAERRVRDEAGRLGEAQAGAEARAHLLELLQELPRDLLAAVERELQTREVEGVVGRQAPLEGEQRRDLSEVVDLVLLDRLQRLLGVEEVQDDRRAAPEEGGHELLGLAADVRRRQVDEHARALVHPERAAEAHVLARDVAVRQERRLGEAGRAGRVDDERAVVLADAARGRAVASEERQDGRVRRVGRPRLQARRRLAEPAGVGGERERGEGARDAVLGRRELHEALDERAVGLHGLPELREVGDRRPAEERVALRPDEAEAADHLGALQPQIERRQHDADLEAGVLEEDVLRQERQGGREEVAFREAQIEQLQRQRRRGPVELGVCPAAAVLGVDDRHRVRRVRRVMRDDAVQDVPLRERLVEVTQRVLGDAVARLDFEAGHGTSPRPCSGIRRFVGAASPR